MKKTAPNEVIAAIITGETAPPLEVEAGECWHERRLYPGLIDGYSLTVDCKRSTRLTVQTALTRPDGTESFATRRELETVDEYAQYVEAVAADVARIGLIDSERFELLPVV